MKGAASSSAGTSSKPKEIVVVGAGPKGPGGPSATDDITVPKPRKRLPAIQKERQGPVQPGQVDPPPS